MKRPTQRPLATSATIAAALISLLAGVQSGAFATKPVPPPCAADGTCLPNRGEWGYYQTNWNRWPGQAEPGPTDAEQVADEDQPSLPSGPVTPGPREEEQRGPVKPLSEQRPGGPAEAPLPQPGFTAPSTTPSPSPSTPPSTPPSTVPSPGNAAPDVEIPTAEEEDDLFDPFGRNQNNLQPNDLATDQVRQASAGLTPPAEATEPTLEQVLQAQQEDAPPALPATLLRATGRAGSPTSAQQQRAERQALRAAERMPRADLTLLQPASLQVAAAARSQVAATEQPVQQATWADDNGIRTIGSDAVGTTQQSTGGVQPAIYFEASDR